MELQFTLFVISYLSTTIVYKCYISQSLSQIKFKIIIAKCTRVKNITRNRCTHCPHLLPNHIINLSAAPLLLDFRIIPNLSFIREQYIPYPNKTNTQFLIISHRSIHEWQQHNTSTQIRMFSLQAVYVHTAECCDTLCPLLRHSCFLPYLMSHQQLSIFHSPSCLVLLSSAISCHF